MTQWQPPDGHPITIEQAKALMAGDLGTVYRNILMDCCAPIYWFRTDVQPLHVMNSGTLTLVRTPERLLGITAAHVVRGWQVDAAKHAVRMQLMNAVLERPSIIAVDDALDLATLALDDTLLGHLGKEVVPLGNWPPQCPQEGRGIMLAGYPGQDRQQTKPREICWGLFTSLGVAQRVTETDVNWRVDREIEQPITGQPPLPANYDLGGISGGPLIAWFEKGGLTHYRLAGIVSEAQSSFEYVVARRADFIRADGTIGRSDS